MPTVEAIVPTPRASRYVTQLARHASAMAGPAGHRMRMPGRNPLAGGEVTLHVAQTEEQVVLTFDPWGTCTLRAGAERLSLRVEAVDEASLQRIQQVITRDLERFGRREELTLTWRRHGPPTDHADPARLSSASTTTRTRPGRIILAAAGVVAVALVAGVHLALGGAALAALGVTALGGLALTALVVFVGHAALPVAVLRLRRHRPGRRDR